MKKLKFNSIEKIISDAKKGKMYILVDDESRENEGDLVFPAKNVTAEKINFMAKYGRGLICLALDGLQAKKLNLNYMSPKNESRNQTAFTVSIEAKKGISTGISAKDRATTIKVATKSNVSKKDIVSPGHVFPIVAREGGVLIRAGHTEASVDICKLAKKNPSAVICEIMNEDGSMAKRDDLFEFAKKHKLSIGKIEDLISYRLKKENFIKLKKTSQITIGKQSFKIKIFENIIDGSEHFALIKGKITKKIPPRVRVISSNIVQNYLLGQKIPNSFNQTVTYFRKFKNFPQNWWPVRSIVVILIASLLMGWTVWFCAGFGNWEAGPLLFLNWLILTGAILVGVVLYLLMILMLREEQSLRLLKWVKKR